MKSLKLALASLALGILVFGTTSANAQAQPGQGQGQGQRGQGRQRGNGNNQGQGGNFDPAAFRDRMMQRYKEQLGSNDEEWKVLQPKLEKVLNAQRDSRSSGGFTGRGGPGGRGNRGGGNNNNNNAQAQADPNQSAVSRAATELRTAVEDKGSTAETLASKVTALREAKEKAKADVTAAQKELRELLTARQEAVLVSSGVLD
jgi:hypothetical protein